MAVPQVYLRGYTRSHLDLHHMGSLVSGKVRLMVESLPTLEALVELLSSVCSMVVEFGALKPCSQCQHDTGLH